MLDSAIYNSWKTRGDPDLVDGEIGLTVLAHPCLTARCMNTIGPPETGDAHEVRSELASAAHDTRPHVASVAMTC